MTFAERVLTLFGPSTYYDKDRKSLSEVEGERMIMAPGAKFCLYTVGRSISKIEVSLNDTLHGTIIPVSGMTCEKLFS